MRIPEGGSAGKLVGKLTDCSIEYLSLNPAVQINRMLDQVHKMVLASGTLEPAGDFALLKSSDSASNKQEDPWKFSCGHVVSEDNFQAICVGHSFDFRYGSRTNLVQMANLADLIY